MLGCYLNLHLSNNLVVCTDVLIFPDSRTITEHGDNTASSPIINVKSVLFNVQEDGLAHNTHHYDLMRHTRPIPVYRRGQYFSITLQFNRPFQLNESFFHLQAEYGR